MMQFEKFNYQIYFILFKKIIIRDKFYTSQGSWYAQLSFNGIIMYLQKFIISKKFGFNI